LEEVRRTLTSPSLVMDGPATLRAIVRDQAGRTIVHVLNLNVERLSSFEDRVTPATEIRLFCRVPFTKVRSVRSFTADTEGAAGALPFKLHKDGNGRIVEATLPKLQLAAMVLIE